MDRVREGQHIHGATPSLPPRDGKQRLEQPLEAGIIPRHPGRDPGSGGAAGALHIPADPGIPGQHLLPASPCSQHVRPWAEDAESQSRPRIPNSRVIHGSACGVSHPRLKTPPGIIPCKSPAPQTPGRSLQGICPCPL